MGHPTDPFAMDSDEPQPDGPTYEPGDGVVRFIGWSECGDSGVSVFRAIIEFPHGPPDLPASIVWDRQPVKIERK
jgi:hypothetical protein